jgi:hypothetical protein
MSYDRERGVTFAPKRPTRSSRKATADERRDFLASSLKGLTCPITAIQAAERVFDENGVRISDRDAQTGLEALLKDGRAIHPPSGNVALWMAPKKIYGGTK